MYFLILDKYTYTQSSAQIWRKIESMGVSHRLDQDFNGSNPEDFNSFFASTQLNTPLRDVDYSASWESGFSFRNVAEDELWKAIFSIKSNAVGLDDIPLKFIKLILPAVSVYILHIINTIFTTSIFPSAWKLAKVRPIPKKKQPG